MLEKISNFMDAQINLAGIQLFCNIAEHDYAKISRILQHCSIVAAKQGQIVLDAQSTGACLYIVLQGALGDFVYDHEEPAPPQAQYLPGESVGEISVLDEERYLTTISALSDSQLLVIDAETVWRLIDESNGVARNLLQLLSFRIRTANAQIRSRQKVGEFFRQLSMVDGLTGLHNRAWLNMQLPMLIDSAQACQNQLSIIMVDIDHFKRFNDENGHLMGDDALQTTAKVLNAGLRPTDFAARYGGEEMIVILPNTSRQSAIRVAERLCHRLQKTKVIKNSDKVLPHVTASFGLATLKEGQDVTALIGEADAALYRAKQGGRNRVST